jgi:hypothetical protein
MIDIGRAPEEAELADALDLIGIRQPDPKDPKRTVMVWPGATTLKEVKDVIVPQGDFYNWLTDRKNRRAIPHRFEAVGYAAHRNPDTKDGLWKVGGERQVVYVKRKLTPLQRREALEIMRTRLRIGRSWRVI